MTTVKRSTYWIYIVSQALLLAGVLTVAVITYRPEDWQPIELLALLTLLSAYGERLAINFGGQTVSAGFISLVLAMTLLGPAPAIAIGVVAIAADSFSRRPPWLACFANLVTYSTYLLVGSLLARLLLGEVHNPSSTDTLQGAMFALGVLGVFIVSNLINFAFAAVSTRVVFGKDLLMQVKTVLIPVLPGQLAAAGLTAMLALVYTKLGYTVLISLLFVLLIFQYLAGALARSEERAEQLHARSMHLASLQLGVLVTLVETLALRDRSTATHAASVARYAHALAREIGCDEQDQDLVRTAALLHDIGKFALPDRILHAELLSDDDWATIRRHPQDGATLVGRLDGYGPVAEIILYHHEHVDGSGYPVGLIGNEIPLLSRVIAVSNSYDTLTARSSYRASMTPQDAIVELRKSAGRSLDADLVESFIALLEREGPIEFTESADASFEAQLAFERRARALAAPTA